MKVFFAAGSKMQMEEILAQNGKYILMSFFYCRKIDMKAMGVDMDNFILDSGAFTFFNGGKNVVWDTYIEEYAAYIIKNDVKHFFELDIENLIGMEEMERLRMKLEKLVGRKCMPVWHRARGVEYFKDLCDKYPYIAIGGMVSNKGIGKADYPILTKMLNYANQRGVHIHGLGFTQMQWLHKIRWYSVDSTSWNGVVMSYRMYRFDGEKMVVKPLTGVTDWKPLMRHNIKQWIMFQKYAENHL